MVVKSKRQPAESPRFAFINVPYAPTYEKVYLAFIAGVTSFGLVPTAAVRDPSSNYQLERIFGLISASDYSFHDLSWMTLDRKPPRTPRFNMPFELGLAVATAKLTNPNHQWFVFDTHPHRLQKALSDLGGIRPRVHDKSPESILRALKNALSREIHQPSYEDLLAIYPDVVSVAKALKPRVADLFDSAPFGELTYAASRSAQNRIGSLRHEQPRRWR